MFGFAFFVLICRVNAVNDDISHKLSDNDCIILYDILTPCLNSLKLKIF